jgi:hypothetical protein
VLKGNHKNLVIEWIGLSGEILSVDKKKLEGELQNTRGSGLLRIGIEK